MTTTEAPTAFESNMKSAHEALRDARYFLFAAKQQTEGGTEDIEELVALANIGTRTIQEVRSGRGIL